MTPVADALTSTLEILSIFQLIFRVHKEKFTFSATRIHLMASPLHYNKCVTQNLGAVK